MRIRVWMPALLVLLMVGCARPPETSLKAGESALYVYSVQKRALLQMRGDLSTVEREIPLSLPACELSHLYAAPGGERLAAEMVCPNGPLALLIEPGPGTVSSFVPDSDMDSHFLAWSADGRRAYLRVNAMAEPRILAVEVPSLRARGLPLDAYTYDLASRPGGGQILFSVSRGLGLGSEMLATRPGGGSARSLLRDARNILALARWSPDGRYIAFIKIPDSQVPYTVGGLWVMDGDGGNPRQLAEADAGHGYAAAWAPEGGRLAFVVRSNPQDTRADQSAEALVSNIHVIEPGGGARLRVTAYEAGRAGTPVWSPDGNTLSFEYVLNGRMDVQIADLTGSPQASMRAIEAACCPVWMRK